jgi:hypothetical protein
MRISANMACGFRPVVAISENGRSVAKLPDFPASCFPGFLIEFLIRAASLNETGGERELVRGPVLISPRSRCGRPIRTAAGTGIGQEA